mmetsp:Transcript_8459/g.26371  ORF Transcript_8459/g.26371 Transcript_8459/m.26371 type:complete len:504 (-) Transcript_8459:236-1747(-)
MERRVGRRRSGTVVAWFAVVVWLCAATSRVALAKGTSSSSSKKTAGVQRNSAMHPRGAEGKRKKSSSSSKSGAKKRKKKASVYEAEDEEEAVGRQRGAMEPYYRPRRKRTAGPSVWQRGMVMAQKAAAQALTTGKQAAERAKVLGAEAAVKAQEASRLAKAYYSSEYEKFLLTATWPSDQRIPPHLTKRLVESVARFPARPHALPDDDPYRVTLRKLWKKMVEKDWRTSLKALTLVHALSRSTPVRNSRALSRVLKNMLGDVDPKTGRKYFNRRDLVALKRDDRKARLVDAYNGLVLRRALLFAAKFDDVAKPGAVCDTPRRAVAEAAKRAGNALLVLDHASLFVEAALADAKIAETHLVVVGCLELVVADINDAFALATRTLAPLCGPDTLNATAPADLGETAAADALRALEKYKLLLPKILKTTKLALKTLRFFDLKAHADLKSYLAEPKLADAIAAWSAVLDAAPRDDPADEDDPDDEDDDDDDDDSQSDTSSSDSDSSS